MSFFDWLFQIDRRRQATAAARRQAQRDQTFDRYIRPWMTNNEYRGMYGGAEYIPTFLPRTPPPMSAAHKTAAKLLRQHLTKDQWARYEANRSFEVKGKHIVYSIGPYASVQVVSPRPGSLCIHTVDNTLPYPDRVLAMKLYIEHAEQLFLDNANFSDDILSLRKIDIKGQVIKGKRATMAARGTVWGQPDRPVPRGNLYGIAELQEMMERLQATTEPFRFEIGRDYVDATTFGDVNRTYLVGEPTITLNGNDVTEAQMEFIRDYLGNLQVRHRVT